MLYILDARDSVYGLAWVPGNMVIEAFFLMRSVPSCRTSPAYDNYMA